MKNITMALPALDIDDSDSEKCLPETIVIRPNKVFNFKCNLII